MCGLLKRFPLTSSPGDPKTSNGKNKCHQDWKTGLKGCRHHIQYCLELGFKMCNKIYSSLNIPPLPSNKNNQRCRPICTDYTYEGIILPFVPSLIDSLTPFVVQRSQGMLKERQLIQVFTTPQLHIYERAWCCSGEYTLPCVPPEPLHSTFHCPLKSVPPQISFCGGDL